MFKLCWNKKKSEVREEGSILQALWGKEKWISICLLQDRIKCLWQLNKQTKQNYKIALWYQLTAETIRFIGSEILQKHGNLEVDWQSLLLEIFVDYGCELKAENMSMGKTGRIFWSLGKLSDLWELFEWGIKLETKYN